MQLYEYKCPHCDTAYTSSTRGDRLDAECTVCVFDGPLVRVFAVNVNRPMQEHFNRTVNAPVSSMRQFEDMLKKRSEEATENTGIEHRYAPVDRADLIKDPTEVMEKHVNAKRELRKASEAAGVSAGTSVLDDANRKKLGIAS